MPRRTKASLRNKQKANKRWSPGDARQETEEPVTPQSSPRVTAKINPDVHVTAVLLTGSTYQQSKEMLEIMNIETPSESTFYEHQKRIAPIIEEIAQETVEDAINQAKEMNHNSFSIDSRWSSRRNGSQNTCTALDQKTNKVVAFHNTIKVGGKRAGDYSGASNMMESIGVSAIASELKSKFGEKKINIVHDGDNKSEKIFIDNEVDCEHSYDKGHAIQSIKRQFKTAKKQAKDTTKISSPFHGIENRVVTYAGFLVDNVNDPEQREMLWKNTPEHLTGNHEHCVHDLKKKVGRKPKTPPKIKAPEEYYIWKKGVQEPKLKQCLQEFCDKTAHVLGHVSNQGCTNPNESINAAQAKYAEKRIAFGNSYGARVGVAIGKWNDPLNFTKNVLEKTGVAE